MSKRLIALSIVVAFFALWATFQVTRPTAQDGGDAAAEGHVQTSHTYASAPRLRGGTSTGPHSSTSLPDPGMAGPPRMEFLGSDGRPLVALEVRYRAMEPAAQWLSGLTDETGGIDLDDDVDGLYCQLEVQNAARLWWAGQRWAIGTQQITLPAGCRVQLDIGDVHYETAGQVVSFTLGGHGRTALIAGPIVELGTFCGGLLEVRSVGALSAGPTRHCLPDSGTVLLQFSQPEREVARVRFLTQPHDAQGVQMGLCAQSTGPFPTRILPVRAGPRELAADVLPGSELIYFALAPTGALSTGVVRAPAGGEEVSVRVDWRRGVDVVATLPRGADVVDATLFVSELSVDGVEVLQGIRELPAVALGPASGVLQAPSRLPPGYQWPGEPHREGGLIRWRGVPYGKVILETCTANAGISRQVLNLEPPVSEFVVELAVNTSVALRIESPDGMDSRDALVTVHSVSVDHSPRQQIGWGAVPREGIVRVVGLKEGEEYVARASGRHGRGEVTFRARAGGEIVVPISPSSSDSNTCVYVVDAGTGQPLPRRTVMYSPDSGIVGFALTGEDGRAQLSPVAGVPAKARVRDDDYDSGWVKVDEGSTTTVSAHRTGRIRLLIGGGFAGDVAHVSVSSSCGGTDSQEGARTCIQKRASVQLWEDGSLDFTGLGSGTYLVEVRLKGAESGSELPIQESVTVGGDQGWHPSVEISR